MPPSSPASTLPQEPPHEVEASESHDEQKALLLIDYLQNQHGRMQARVLTLKSQTANLIGFIIGTLGAALAVLFYLLDQPAVLHVGTPWVAGAFSIGCVAALVLSIITYFPRFYQDAPFAYDKILVMNGKTWDLLLGTTIYNLSKSLDETYRRYQNHTRLHEWAIGIFLASLTIAFGWSGYRILAAL